MHCLIGWESPSSGVCSCGGALQKKKTPKLASIGPTGIQSLDCRQTLTDASIVDDVEECHGDEDHMEEWSNTDPFRLQILVLPTPESATARSEHSRWGLVAATEPGSNFVQFQLTEWGIGCEFSKKDNSQISGWTSMTCQLEDFPKEADVIEAMDNVKSYVMWKRNGIFGKFTILTGIWLTFAVVAGWIEWPMDLWIVFRWVISESHFIRIFLVRELLFNHTDENIGWDSRWRLSIRLTFRFAWNLLRS